MWSQVCLSQNMAPNVCNVQGSSFKHIRRKTMPWIRRWVNPRDGLVLRRTVTFLSFYLEVVWVTICSPVLARTFIVVIFPRVYAFLEPFYRSFKYRATYIFAKLACADIVVWKRICISRCLGEHRGEIQGSVAIHDILKEQIAFLSGNVVWPTCTPWPWCKIEKGVKRPTFTRLCKIR